MPIDFYAKGYLEKFTGLTRPGSYMHVMDGTLKELVEYACARSNRRGLIERYRITVGTAKYTGREIRHLSDDPSYPRADRGRRSIA